MVMVCVVMVMVRVVMVMVRVVMVIEGMLVDASTVLWKRECTTSHYSVDIHENNYCDPNCTQS